MRRYKEDKDMTMQAVWAIIMMMGGSAANINAIIELGEKAGEAGKKLSAKVQKVIERAKQEKKEDENAEEIEITAEESAEVKKECAILLSQYARPVYMGGVVLICETALSEEDQETVRNILTSINGDLGEWDDDEANRYQKTVDEFMVQYVGESVNLSASDCEVYADFIYINFSLDDEPEYYRLYQEDDLRSVADAINHILGQKAITSFAAY
jgi:hypothetical protein